MCGLYHHSLTYFFTTCSWPYMSSSGNAVFFVFTVSIQINVWAWLCLSEGGAWVEMDRHTVKLCLCLAFAFLMRKISKKLSILLKKMRQLFYKICKIMCVRLHDLHLNLHWEDNIYVNGNIRSRTLGSSFAVGIKCSWGTFSLSWPTYSFTNWKTRPLTLVGVVKSGRCLVNGDIPHQCLILFSTQSS